MEMYQGEIIGEVLFNRMLAFYDDPLQRYKVSVMLQLETETKARLRPVIMRLGLDPAESEESRRAGHKFAESLAGLNRTTGHSYTQAASCEISSCAISAARSAWTAAVTSGV